MAASGRTRLGKVVGSVRTDPAGWTYRPQDAGFVLVAPSGARMDTVANESDARRRVAEENRQWFAPARVCSCGEPEDGGDFGWFDADDGHTYCNACGSKVAI